MPLSDEALFDNRVGFPTVEVAKQCLHGGTLQPLRADMTRMLFGQKSKNAGAELWQGGLTSALDSKRNGFDCVVFLAEEDQPSPGLIAQLAPVEVLCQPFDDCELTYDHWRRAGLMAQEVCKRLRDNRKVLVTCHMGYNRSGLVVALACHMLSKKSGEQIVRSIQMKRLGALSNKSFANRLKLL